MKKNHYHATYLLMVCCMATAISTVSFAEETGETDIYGNVIDWDTNEPANEENQDVDNLNENTIILPEETEQSIDETETEESMIDDDEATAFVHAHFYAPNNWGNEDIFVSIYNLDTDHLYNIFLEHDLGYKGDCHVAAGNYEVRGANIAGDSINGQPIYSETSNFVIKSGEEITLELRPAKQEITETEETIMETEPVEETNNSNGGVSESKKITVIPFFVKISSICVVVISSLLIYIKKKRR